MDTEDSVILWIDLKGNYKAISATAIENTLEANIENSLGIFLRGLPPKFEMNCENFFSIDRDRIKAIKLSIGNEINF